MGGISSNIDNHNKYGQIKLLKDKDSWTVIYKNEIKLYVVYK